MSSESPEFGIIGHGSTSGAVVLHKNGTNPVIYIKNSVSIRSILYIYRQMCSSIYIYICICMYVYIYVYIYIYMHVCIEREESERARER